MTYYHYVSDEHGSITHVTDAETGEVLNHYTYDAFGNTMKCDEKVHNRFRYNGEQYDPLTSQYYLRARFYNPVIARFTQEDTYYGDGLNLYQYCANNPIAYVDPSGHNICQTQRDVYHEKCEAYMREHGLSDYSQIPKNEKTRMFKEMRTELGKTSDSKYKGSGTSPDFNAGETTHPTFKVSRKQYPNHVKMLENAKQEGHSLTDLTRGAGTRAAQKNRYESQKAIRKQQGGPPKGYDYDEFPYASTKQGGAGAHVEPVPSAENQAVGRDLGQFYRKYNIQENGIFDVEIVD